MATDQFDFFEPKNPQRALSAVEKLLADEILTAFLELERVTHETLRFQMPDDSGEFSPCNLLRASPSGRRKIDCRAANGYPLRDRDLND